MTPAEEQAYVRERWDDAGHDTSSDSVYICILGEGAKVFRSWHLAYLFTRRRETEIADVEEGISYLRTDRDEMKKRCSCELIEAQPKWLQIWGILNGIIAREQAALADLRRGWKDQG